MFLWQAETSNEACTGIDFINLIAHTVHRDIMLTSCAKRAFVSGTFNSHIPKTYIKNRQFAKSTLP